jgi:hypothetical protein
LLEGSVGGQHSSDRFKIHRRAGELLQKINRSEHLAIVVAAGLGNDAHRLRMKLETQLGHDRSWFDEFVAAPCAADAGASIVRTIGELNVDMPRSCFVSPTLAHLAIAEAVGCPARLATDVSTAVEAIVRDDASAQRREAA